MMPDGKCGYQHGKSMWQSMRTTLILTPLLLPSAMAPVLAAGQPASGHVDFDRDVRPILAENCFACHGFDANKRQAGLRLDVADGPYKRLPSGKIAVVPRNPAASE